MKRLKKRHTFHRVSTFQNGKIWIGLLGRLNNRLSPFPSRAYLLPKSFSPPY